MKHLHQIRGRWAVRIGVPDTLRNIIGKRELREWLGTDKNVAQRSAPAVIARFYQQIDEAKALLEGSSQTLRAAAQHHYARELAADDRERSALGGTAEFRSFTAPIKAAKLRLLVAHQLPRDEAEALIGYAADDAIADGAVNPALERGELLRVLAEIHLEAMARFEERDAGRIALSDPKSEWLAAEQPAGVV
ncbi:hypothetical protein PSQ90_15320 [Devosia rhodophyticola]|uniref:DUF6538 domain-containing protein n=1 Tax=Devosia rhodophyticola TaxID=3026423 RepID=A0ABY7YWN9_9HYPH|nr:DUF6538 domain-containing protein [Devosia rhodophyticola]WDR05617.1 hypothetical protein PSQ90_15320 [Devosia rhodophyticola]